MEAIKRDRASDWFIALIFGFPLAIVVLTWIAQALD